MPTITMMLTGRTGNLLFQYAHLRAYAEQNGYAVSLPPWIGERVFAGVPEAIRPDKYKPDLDLGENLRQKQSDLIYTRKQVREWFAFKSEVLEKLQPAKCESDVLLNVRCGNDYIGAGLVCISVKSYIDACHKSFPAITNYDLETDVHPTLLPSFTGNPSASGLGTTEVCLPSFYRLMTAPILFRANSTFSYWASVLGSGRTFAPIIDGMVGGIPNQHCNNFVEGNWPRMSQDHTDLHLLP